MNSKNISVRLRPENYEDFYILKEIMSDKDPLRQDYNNNQLVNYCINNALDYHEKDIQEYKANKRKEM